MTVKEVPFGDYSGGNANNADALLDSLNSMTAGEKTALRGVLDVFVGLLGGEAKTGGFVDADRIPTELRDQFKAEVDWLKGSAQLR